MEFIEKMQDFSRKNIKVLNDDKIVQICLDHDFNLEKIKQHLKKYETEDKYKDMQAYEWNTTKSRVEL